jgi:hypothetical protein
LRRDARRLADAFSLPLRSLAAERANVKRRYGVCFDDGSIRVRLRHVRTGRALKYSGLVDTLCHELAHLRHFDHGPAFQAFYRQVLEYARRRGIYRPDSRGAGHRRPRTSGPAVSLRASSILPLASLAPRPRPPRESREAPRRDPRPRRQLELF